MPRTRELKPAFFQDEDLATLSRDHRLLFQSLWTLADREGRLEDRPAWIKLYSFPFDADVQSTDIDRMLTDLAAHSGRFITRYQANGKRYLSVENFKKHQHIHPKEAESTIPAFSGSPDFSGKVPEIPEPTRERNHFSPMPSEPSCTSLPSLTASDPARARSNAGANEPGKPSTASVLARFSAIRAETCATKALFYQASETAKAKCAALLAEMDRETVEDIEPAIRLACEHVRDGSEGWTDNRMRDPNFLWGTIAARWTALREELHGRAPPMAPTKADQKANEQRTVIENWRPRDERERQA